IGEVGYFVAWGGEVVIEIRVGITGVVGGDREFFKDVRVLVFGVVWRKGVIGFVFGKVLGWGVRDDWIEVFWMRRRGSLGDGMY
ncbi:hypothetical protein, partial [Neisseria sicca]|uniref:hypothetical protein n=1 Tax=Neisseria sicca TaxID=490 RepID=UPI001649E0FD